MILRAGSRAFEVRKTGEIRFGSGEDAIKWLKHLGYPDPDLVLQFRRVLAHYAGESDNSRLTDQQVVENLAAMLHARRIVMIGQENQMSAGQPVPREAPLAPAFPLSERAPRRSSSSSQAPLNDPPTFAANTLAADQAAALVNAAGRWNTLLCRVREIVGRIRKCKLMNHQHAIEEVLWSKSATADMWMIVDCARDQQAIFRFLLSCHLEHSCLFSGYLPPPLEMAAPYLVQLDHDNWETRRLIELSWGNSWGIFLKSGASMIKLRRHLREFLIVRDSQGKRLAFRYYDPRVLRTYLPTCNGEELRTVFGPIQSFWTEDHTGADRMLEFRMENGRLVKSSFPLTARGEGNSLLHRGQPD